MVLLDWHALGVNLFKLGTSDLAVSLAEKVLRPIVVYLLLVVALRTVGKRILAQLNPFDFVVLLTLSNTVQNAIIGNDSSLSGGILGAASLLAVNSVLVRIFYRGPGSEHRMNPEDDICLIDNHEPKEAELARLHINRGELTARAHERGFDSLEDVKKAVLYPNGTIYMMGDEQESKTLDRVLSELQLLRRDVAALRQ